MSGLLTVKPKKKIVPPFPLSPHHEVALKIKNTRKWFFFFFFYLLLAFKPLTCAKITSEVLLKDVQHFFPLKESSNIARSLGKISGAGLAACLRNKSCKGATSCMQGRAESCPGQQGASACSPMHSSMVEIAGKSSSEQLLLPCKP